MNHGEHEEHGDKTESALAGWTEFSVLFVFSVVHSLRSVVLFSFPEIFSSTGVAPETYRVFGVATSPHSRRQSVGSRPVRLDSSHFPGTEHVAHQRTPPRRSAPLR